MSTSSMAYAKIFVKESLSQPLTVCCSIDVNFKSVHSGQVNRGQFVKDTKIMGSDPGSNHSIPVCCVSCLST